MATLKLTEKYKPYPKYKDSGITWIGKMPEEWNITPLFNVAQENREKNTRLQCADLRSLSYGSIIEKDINHTGGLLPASFSTYQIIQKGMIVMRLTDLQNDKRSLRVGFVTQDKSGIITSAYLGLRFNQKTNKKYLYYLLHSYDLLKVYYGLGGGVRQSLDFWNLRHMPILLPSTPMQASIVKYLEKKTALIDTIIEKKQKQIELLQEKRTAIINHAVTKGLDPKVELVDSDIEWIGKIPKGWEVKKIKHVIQSTTSGVWGDEEKNDEYDIKCLRVADFDYENVSYKSIKTVRNNFNISQVKVLKQGDLLIEKSGGGEKTPVGRVVHFDGDTKATCANFIDIVRVDTSIIIPMYLTLFLYSLYSSGAVKKYIKQNTGIQNLDIDAYFSEMATIPSLEDQQQIIRNVQEILISYEALKKKIKRSINLLQEYKSSLISHVVTGKIRV